MPLLIFSYHKFREYLISVVNSRPSNAIIYNIQRFFGISEKGQVTNFFYYRYFVLASALVDEAVAVIPAIFLCFYPLGQCLITHFLFFYLSGQITKELYLLPRPKTQPKHHPSTPIAVLDKNYETECGLPSTHTMAGCLPFPLLMKIHQLDPLSDTSFWIYFSLAAFYSISVSLSRLYLGVHSPLDIAGGYLLAAIMSGIYTLGGERFDSLMYESPAGMQVLLAMVVAFLVLYPQPKIWSVSCGVGAPVVYGQGSALRCCIATTTPLAHCSCCSFSPKCPLNWQLTHLAQDTQPQRQVH